MARVLVGLPVLQGDIHKYAKRFDLVELRPIDTSVPRLATLRAHRKAVPPGFVFSVVLPRIVGALAPGTELDEALATSLEVAVAVEARCIVLATPPTVRPTAANRKRIAALFERLPREGVVLAWEPAGMWEHEDVVATAQAAKVLPVFDAATDALPSGPIAYTRLRALGKSASIGTSTIDRVAERLRGRREAFVVVERPSEAARVKAGLTAALARKRSEGRGGMVIRPGAAPSALIAEDEEQ
jgi:uncharacterized protein YecE (DUF72 family)